MKKLTRLIASRRSFVIDKTNVSTIERQKLLERLKAEGYRTAAIVLELPNEYQLKERMLKRAHKQIPMEVIDRMKENYMLGMSSLMVEFD